MKNLLTYFLLISSFLLGENIYAQTEAKDSKSKAPAELFRSSETLPIKLSFSIKEIKKLTNDSTYINTNLGYLDKDGSQKEIKVQLRVRGYFRLNNCHFPPLKVVRLKRKVELHEEIRD